METWICGKNKEHNLFICLKGRSGERCWEQPLWATSTVSPLANQVNLEYMVENIF